LKIAYILYNDLTSNQINSIFENKLYLKENKKELNTSNTQKVSYAKFKSLYLPKIVKFLNANIRNKSDKKELFDFEKSPLGIFNTVADINKLCLKVIPGMDMKLDPFNIKDIRQGASTTDLIKYKKIQTITFMLKLKDNSVLGSENASKNDTIYIITIPPLFTEIGEDNLDNHVSVFGKDNLVYSDSNNCYYYNEYSLNNVNFKMLDEEAGHIEYYQKYVKGQIQKTPGIDNKQIQLRGTENSSEKTTSEK